MNPTARPAGALPLTALTALIVLTGLAPSPGQAGNLDQLIEQNIRLMQIGHINCAPDAAGPVAFYVDPFITGDTWVNDVGRSWTLIVHRSQRINGVAYHKGHLVSPRGGTQPEVGYARVSEWSCIAY